MSTDQDLNRSAGILGPIVGLGGRAASTAIRPITSAVAGVTDRVLDGGEPERLLIAALNDDRIQTALRHAMDTEGVKELVDRFFDSGLFDHFVDRLLTSDALWRLVDEIAQSPAVLAAVSQQGLGFADQVGDAVRGRSRRADRAVERTAGRLVHRRAKPNGGGSDT